MARPRQIDGAALGRDPEPALERAAATVLEDGCARSHQELLPQLLLHVLGVLLARARQPLRHTREEVRFQEGEARAISPAAGAGEEEVLEIQRRECLQRRGQVAAEVLEEGVVIEPHAGHARPGRREPPQQRLDGGAIGVEPGPAQRGQESAGKSHPEPYSIGTSRPSSRQPTSVEQPGPPPEREHEPNKRQLFLRHLASRLLAGINLFGLHHAINAGDQITVFITFKNSVGDLPTLCSSVLTGHYLPLVPQLQAPSPQP